MKEPSSGDMFAAKALLFILGFSMCILFLVGYNHANAYAHKSLGNTKSVYKNEVSDEVLSARYAHGVEFFFHNSDPASQQAIGHIADALEGIEELANVDLFRDNYLVEVWGATYNAGVVPFEFDISDPEDPAMVVRLPNHIELVHITSDGLLGDIGDIYLSDIHSDITIRISRTR